MQGGGGGRCGSKAGVEVEGGERPSMVRVYNLLHGEVIQIGVVLCVARPRGRPSPRPRPADLGGSAGGPEGRHWVLDPIDGTRGFVTMRQYSVCLGLLQDGEVRCICMGRCRGPCLMQHCFRACAPACCRAGRRGAWGRARRPCGGVRPVCTVVGGRQAASPCGGKPARTPHCHAAAQSSGTQ